MKKNNISQLDDHTINMFINICVSLLKLNKSITYDKANDNINYLNEYKDKNKIKIKIIQIQI